jgi:uncharacterized protein YjbI with pentapeptide repeats
MKEEIKYLIKTLNNIVFEILLYLNYQIRFINSSYLGTRYYYNLIKSSFSFWSLAIILFVISNLIVFVLSMIPRHQVGIGFLHIFDLPHFAQFINQSINERLEFGVIWSNSDNSRYILSALSQALAAIFAIFFTINLLIFQIKLKNYNIPPGSYRKFFTSPVLVFIFIIYSISIIGDLILLSYVDLKDNTAINLFWPFVLGIFSILILLPYMRITLLDVLKSSLIDEIRTNTARSNLDEIDLKGANLRGIVFAGKTLTGSNLEEANLSGSALSDSVFDRSWCVRINFSDAKLIRCSFKGAYLIEADFSGASLQEHCDFTDAHLVNARFMKSDIGTVQFNNSNLFKADFSEAKIESGNFINSIFLRSIFAKASWDGSRIDGSFFDKADFNHCKIGKLYIKNSPHTYNSLENAKNLESLDSKIISIP